MASEINFIIFAVTILVIAAFLESVRQKHLISGIPLFILILFLCYWIVQGMKPRTHSKSMPSLERVLPEEDELDKLVLTTEEIIIQEKVNTEEDTKTGD